MKQLQAERLFDSIMGDRHAYHTLPDGSKAPYYTLIYGHEGKELEEEALVQLLEDDLLILHKTCKTVSPKLFWRIRPQLEHNGREWKLRCRVAIPEADWTKITRPFRVTGPDGIPGVEQA